MLPPARIAFRTASTSLIIAALLCAQTPPAADTGIVEGRVLGPLGEPMVNVEVTAAVWPQIRTIVAKTRTDGDGMFVLARVPAKMLWLNASTPGHTTAGATSWLTTDRPQDAVPMRMWPANTLRGRVVDADGKPVTGAVVLATKDFTWFENHFRSPEMVTAADGSFELAGVPIGDCVLRASAPGFLMREHQLVALADQEVEVRLERGEGSVLSARTVGLPADAFPRVQVSWYATRHGSGFSMARQFEYGTLDEQGRWRLAGLPDAEMHLELSVDGFTFDPRSVSTKMGEPLRELVFTATAIGSLQLRGVLRSVDGKPLVGERLECRTKKSQSMSGGSPGEATTDAEGRFVMNAPLVADEPYTLHLVGSKWVLEQRKTEGMTGVGDARYLVRYEDKADGAREVTLVAQPAALVAAKLVDETGRPVPFAWTELQQRSKGRMPEWMALAYGTSRRDGSVAFPGVHAGVDDLRVHTEGAAGAGESEPFQLGRGERRQLVVTLQRPGAITGCVVDAAGKPVAGYRVSLRNYDATTGKQTDGGWTNVPTGRDGRFVFVGVVPGGHKVENVSSEKRASTSEVFEVRSGATVDVQLRLQK